MSLPTPDQIAATEPVIRPYIRRTPTVEIDGAELGLDAARLTFKLELYQHAGAFKSRGAFANLLLRKVPPPGVVAASGGNHGAAVAYAAMTLGIPATIFVPSICSPAKIDRIRSFGATLMVGGERYGDALAESERFAERSGALRVHAFDQHETILGQGTLGLELDQQAPGLDTVLVPIGGGGLISGVASWFAGRARIVGVEPELSPTLTRALEAGRPVDAPTDGIAADSLAPSRVGELNFPIAKRWVDRVILVTDDDIRQAQSRLWQTLRVVVEPGGATATAALLARRYQPRPGERVGVLLSGGNTVAVDFARQMTPVAADVASMAAR
ncbi:MAG TPA: threonine/serine dehydratase [Gemmatimonadaceae bacterium]|nr:threonine/serine dehydratase [Gemmatimonadaceae bacterium]